MARRKAKKTAGNAAGVAGLIEGVWALGSSIIRGVDPAEAAEALDKFIAKRGGDAGQIWTTLYKVSAEKLQQHHPVDCQCHGQARWEPNRCLNCGGTFTRMEVVQ